jgi:hypothetical protein
MNAACSIALRSTSDTVGVTVCVVLELVLTLLLLLLCLTDLCVSLDADCFTGTVAIISLYADLSTRLPPKMASPVAVSLWGVD